MIPMLGERPQILHFHFSYRRQLDLDLYNTWLWIGR